MATSQQKSRVESRPLQSRGQLTVTLDHGRTARPLPPPDASGADSAAPSRSALSRHDLHLSGAHSQSRARNGCASIERLPLQILWLSREECPSRDQSVETRGSPSQSERRLGLPLSLAWLRRESRMRTSASGEGRCTRIFFSIRSTFYEAPTVSCTLLCRTLRPTEVEWLNISEGIEERKYHVHVKSPSRSCDFLQGVPISRPKRSIKG
jgi:hypothetical protein